MMLPENDPGLTLTANALQHIRRVLRKAQRTPMGLRVGVKKAGCSGYEYVLEYAYPDTQTPLDYCFEKEEINILVDKEIYWKFLKGGTTLDFKKEGLNEGLDFDNPNVGHQCGCGESFTLVDE